MQQAVLLLTRLERTLHEAVSGMQNASVAADKTRARAAVLEGLLQDKELLMLNLSESMDQLRISSDRSVGEYELQMAELHGIICKLKDSRDSDASVIFDLKACNEHIHREKEAKDKLAERLQRDLKQAIAATRDAHLLIREGDAKLSCVEQRLREKEELIRERDANFLCVERRLREKEEELVKLREAVEHERREWMERETERVQERHRENQRIQEEERDRTRFKEEQAQNLGTIAELQSELAEAKRRHALMVEKTADNVEALLKQAKGKEDALEQLVKERDEEILKNHATITQLGDQILQGGHLLRSEQEKRAETAEEMQGEVEKWKSALAQANLSIARLEGKVQEVGERLEEVSLIASEVPHLRQCKQRMLEVAFSLEQEKSRALDRERQHNQSLAVAHSEKRLILARLQQLEREAEMHESSIGGEKGRNRALLQELEQERATLVQHQTQTQQLVEVNEELQAELDSALETWHVSVSITAQLEESLISLGRVVQQATSQAVCMRDADSAVVALRMRAGKLAALVSEMEMTLVQTEQMLAEESGARERAEKALAILQDKHSLLHGDHDSKYQPLGRIQNKSEELEGGCTPLGANGRLEGVVWRQDLEYDAAARKDAQAHEQHDIHSIQQVLVAQQHEISKWRRRADDMQIHANCVAVGLYEIGMDAEALFFLLSRCLDESLALQDELKQTQHDLEAAQQGRRLVVEDNAKLEMELEEVRSTHDGTALRGSAHAAALQA